MVVDGGKNRKLNTHYAAGGKVNLAKKRSFAGGSQKQGKEKRGENSSASGRPTRGGKTTVANSPANMHVSAYLRIKFPEEVNKSAMKKTCSALNTGQKFLPLSVANIKSQLVKNISPGSKRPQASGPSAA